MTIKEEKIKDFLDDLASKQPTPGGGAVAALAGAMAAALVSMVAKISLAQEEDFKEVGEKAEKLRKELLSLADEDCQAFERVIQAYRLPKETHEQQERRNKEIQEALKEAALLPLRTAEEAVEVVKMAGFCAREGNQNAISDARVGIELATAAVYGALENVRLNLESIKDLKFCEDLKEEMDDLLECQDLKTG
jgi:formiminotetrahydrofolate cyclodeaminase